jgi:hypothetical protein
MSGIRGGSLFSKSPRDQNVDTVEIAVIPPLLAGGRDLVKLLGRGCVRGLPPST